MSVVPTHYALEFEPNFDDFTFRGRARISAWCYEPVSEIDMDAAELAVRSCRVVAGDQILDAAATLDDSGESLLVSLPQKISGGCIIDIDYTGSLNDRLLGFYRSRYAHGSKTKFLATTQFEAADARRAFPCWDEPNHKATFDVTIVAPQGMTAISNMPARSVKKRRDKTIYRFKKTPPMSTYLLYLGVGEFEFLEKDGGKIRVVTTRGKSKRGKYAMEIASKLLAAYEDYFDKPYPLPKLDLIALPDFAAGAMENWGAITFRENILLYDPRNSSTRTKQLIAEVVSHELAHQWFGNLVTMEWWNDLWLNESFATFMATKMVDRFHPEWNMWDQFVDDSMNAAMEMDSLRSTHPIDIRVDSPSQIREIFDAISYDKGGCILRMLEDFVGEASFKKGLRKYLRAFKYGNATGEDLWDSIQWASRVQVRPMVDLWLKRSGFPVVEASSSGFQLNLKQERFYMDGGRVSDQGMWLIPMRFLDGRSVRMGVLEMESAEMGLPRKFVANHGRTGFYRVQYGGLLLDEVKSMVVNREINALDRWAVQNDLFAFCLAGRVGVLDYLDFVEAYSDEDEYMPLANVGRNLSLLLNMSHSLDWARLVEARARPYFSGMLDMLGWAPSKKDGHTDAFLRSMAISSLGWLDRGVARKAREMFSGFLERPASVHPDIRGPVFAAAACRGGVRLHSRMRSLFGEVDSIEEKLRVLAGMCEFGNPSLLVRTLDFSLTDEVRSQNMQLPIVRVASNPYGRGILWPWLRDHWGDLESKIGHGNPLFNRIVAGIAMATDGSEADEIREFFGRNPVPGTERTQAQMLEMVSIYSNFRRRAARDAASIT